MKPIGNLKELFPDTSGKEMPCEIVNAAESNRAEVLALYRMMLGREFCFWDEDYPSNETFDFDLSRDALFVLKMEGRIKATVSIELDDEVEKLPLWDESLSPAGELARLAVHPDLQSRGFGKLLLQFGMDELKKRGFRGVHFLVNKGNKIAIRCYQNFGFHIAGECHLYDQDFLCYEKALK